MKIQHKIKPITPENDAYDCKIRKNCVCLDLCSITRSKFKDVIDIHVEESKNSWTDYSKYILDTLDKLRKDMLIYLPVDLVNDFMFIINTACSSLTLNPCKNLIHSKFDYERKRTLMETHIDILEWFSVFIHKYFNINDFSVKKDIVLQVINEMKDKNIWRNELIWIILIMIKYTK